jgi:choline dehydrogenase
VNQSSDESFDYVVVGSGAGGGPVAANLAKAGFSVLLLEAGIDYHGLSSQVPAFHPISSEDPEMAWNYYVKHYSDPARQRCDSKYVPEEQGILYPRAGTLGGCTAHNAMITMVPHTEDWDRIAELTGDDSWRSEAMWSYFERLEDCRYMRKPSTDPVRKLALRICEKLGLFGLPNPTRHGRSGWLSTSLSSIKLGTGDSELIDMVKAAVKAEDPDTWRDVAELLRSLGPAVERLVLFGENVAIDRVVSYLDPNDWRNARKNPEGLVLVPLAILDGSRTGPREYLRRVAAVPGSRLTIRTQALASRILFDDDNRAVGVEYLEGAHLYRASPKAAGQAEAGTLRTVGARREVILSCGTFNTPQLLMLSGIGPRSELQKWNIPVRVDLPGVGHNLQDRYEICVVSEMAKDFEILRQATFTIPTGNESPDPLLSEWLQHKTGLYTSNGVVLGVIRRSRSDSAAPDLFIFGLPGSFKGYYPGYSADSIKKKNFFTWAILKAHTRNTAGTVTLRSADPRDVPEIDFHYFDEGNDTTGQDLQAVLEGVEFVRQISKEKEILVQIRGEAIPGNAFSSEEDLRQFIRNEAWGHHASCTCKIGAPDDPMAVLDSKFRVRQTRNLRVVDASVFPRIPGFFIVTPIYMIAEKATDDLLAEARRGAA